MWKCFWSQILLMKMNKSYCTMPALTKLQTRGDLNLLLAGQPVNESEWHQCQKPVHGRSFPITTKLLVTTIEIFWVLWLQSQIPSSWGVRSPDPHRRVGRGTWLASLTPVWQFSYVIKAAFDESVTLVSPQTSSASPPYSPASLI